MSCASTASCVMTSCWPATSTPAARLSAELLPRHIDAGRLLRPGPQEREIRACAVYACDIAARQLGMPARTVDHALWNRGQDARYKAVPRHRCRTIAY